uniref:Uncharacterized protein n=1 Tax=Arundo donax TaxID=35708 RepID=A0A0A9BX09_ARUDO
MYVVNMSHEFVYFDQTNKQDCSHQTKKERIKRTIEVPKVKFSH